MDLVPQQQMENGLNSQMVFQDEALQFSGRKTREVSDFVDENMFSVGRDRFFRLAPGADFRRSIFDSSPGRQEQPENQNWNNGDGSTGTPSGEGSEGEEEDDDEDEDEKMRLTKLMVKWKAWLQSTMAIIRITITAVIYITVWRNYATRKQIYRNTILPSV
ncbi:hypothetical protein NE237_011842 [Protea cynaroides]|uniref:Uncharacterized protein n=1 Tax=Protea cynaroides TaxID=273540 RepID=A0A9Q0H0Q1_9MAGN|nr:hypothetical protein NE237_011842 [Protea cynaroides]